VKTLGERLEAVIAEPVPGRIGTEEGHPMGEESAAIGAEEAAGAPTVPLERRAQPRIGVAPPAGAFVLLPFPDTEEEECEAPIRDISYGGVSFRLAGAFRQIDEGWVGRARLRFGARIISGNLLVVHVAPDAESGTVCGAMFFAASKDDRRTLRAVLSELGQS